MADDDRGAILGNTGRARSSKIQVVAAQHLAFLMSDKSARSPPRTGEASEHRRRTAISMLEKLSENNTRVRNAEWRLMIQRAFIDRLEAAQRDTTSAEESLEVMRNLLGDLYQERTALRRHLASQSRQGVVLGKGAASRRGGKSQKSPR